MSVGPAERPELDHVGIVVPDLEGSVRWLDGLFGLTPTEVLRNPTEGVRVRFLALGNARLELLQPEPGNKSLARFLARHPRGALHHLSLRVSDLDSSSRRARAGGAELTGPPGRTVEGHRMCFLRPAENLGVLFELEEHAELGAAVEACLDAGGQIKL